MTKKEMLAKLHETLKSEGLTKKAIEATIEAYHAAITVSLIAGEVYILGKIGRLLPINRKPRKGFNPRTKKSVIIPERKTVTFKANTILKESLNKKSKKK